MYTEEAIGPPPPVPGILCIFQVRFRQHLPIGVRSCDCTLYNIRTFVQIFLASSQINVNCDLLHEIRLHSHSHTLPYVDGKPLSSLPVKVFVFFHGQPQPTIPSHSFSQEIQKENCKNNLGVFSDD